MVIVVNNIYKKAGSYSLQFIALNMSECSCVNVLKKNKIKGVDKICWKFSRH